MDVWGSWRLAVAVCVGRYGKWLEDFDARLSRSATGSGDTHFARRVLAALLKAGEVTCILLPFHTALFLLLFLTLMFGLLALDRPFLVWHWAFAIGFFSVPATFEAVQGRRDANRRWLASLPDGAHPRVPWRVGRLVEVSARLLNEAGFAACILLPVHLIYWLAGLLLADASVRYGVNGPALHTSLVILYLYAPEVWRTLWLRHLRASRWLHDQGGRIEEACPTPLRPAAQVVVASVAGVLALALWLVFVASLIFPFHSLRFFVVATKPNFWLYLYGLNFAAFAFSLLTFRHDSADTDPAGAEDVARPRPWEATWQGWVAEFRRWLAATPPPAVVPVPLGGECFVTGPGLIEQIVDAISLDQSLVLSGPRGSGKSFCIRGAIEEAARSGILPKDAWVLLQGNPEFPRDYLSEDEIAFKTVKTADGEDRVLPYRRTAPLFQFAERDKTHSNPVVGEDGRVRCELKDSEGKPVLDHQQKPIPCGRFVLFLDEINRFSNGILDSLLSVLEEREAVLAGQRYKLPVVVLMTMNPPGYDASARKLSPPLAARISRDYSLCSPDLGTLCDQVIKSRMERLEEEWRSERVGRPDEERRAFPAPSRDLIVRTALVTLCLWGDVDDTRRTALEYLTPDTKRLLSSLMQSHKVLADEMRKISEHCPYGPDGRAANDWLTAAVGLVLRARSPLPAEVQLTQALVETAVVSLSHKIFDNFSPASRPDLTKKKQDAIRKIVRIALVDKVEIPGWPRLVDSHDELSRRFPAALYAAGAAAKDLYERKSGLRDVFAMSGVTLDSKVEEILATIDESSRPALDSRNLRSVLLRRRHLVPVDGGGEILQFADRSTAALFRRLRDVPGPLANAIHELTRGRAASVLL